MAKAMVLRISGDTVEEIRDKLIALAHEFGAPKSDETKPRGRKKEEKPSSNGTVHLNGNGHAVPPVLEEPEDIFATDPPPAKAAAAKASSASREDVNRAVMEVQTKKGLPVARELISKFGAKRLAEVKEKDFAAVIQACKAV